jgi:hypothetical protein
MTSIAVRGDWFLRLPVTVETRGVLRRNRFERGGSRCVTDGAVIVALRRMREAQKGDRVLVLVVWKLGRELELRRGIAKRVTHIITRRCFRMTHGTDRRPRTAEELRPVTTHARFMAGIIRDVRKRDLVAGDAGCLVLLC